LSLEGLGRFRVNVFRERGKIRIVMRSVPITQPTLAELNLPERSPPSPRSGAASSW
jgi:Tfp pilus assembly pilus retraction ATPase PilT